MDSLTLPAHIENGALHLDAPLPSNVAEVESVEVRLQFRPSRHPRRPLSEILRSLPLGTKTADELDREINELRADRNL